MTTPKLRSREFDRLYLQYRPDGDARDRLESIQHILTSSGMTGRVVGAGGMHLTAIHIGVLTDVFAQLRTLRPDMTTSHFDTAIDDLIDELNDIQPESFALQPTRLLALGRYGTAMTLGFRLSPTYESVHGCGVSAVRQFLAELGIESDPHDIPPAPRALQLGHSALQPHVTLIKGAQPQHMLTMPPEFVSQPMNFDRAPLTY